MTPELLAPAGTIEAGLAALDAGADAVYAGLARFNARERSRNFTLEELSKLLAFARKKGRRLYVTLNTLIKEQELPAITDLLAELAVMRPDAVIVQDIGLVRLIREFFPVLTIHASTQMGLHNSAGLHTAERMGIRRVILERQITFEEIRRIRRQTDIELELFVHGALCCSRAGRCLFSSWMGGWSGNRGKCKQPCRRRYFSENGNGFFFSTGDLYSLESIPDLKTLGIAGFKIEGRLRDPDYVHHVVSAYRLMLDSQGRKPDVLKQAKSILAGAFGRKWAPAFRTQRQFENVMQPTALGTAGRICAKVTKTGKGGFLVNVGRTLRNGDRVRVQPDSGEEGPAFTITRMTVEGKTVPHAHKGDACWIHYDRTVAPRALVYKIGVATPGETDARVQTMPESPAVMDLAITLQATDIHVRIPDTALAWNAPVNLDPARKHALTAETVTQEFRKTRIPTLAAGRIAVSVPEDVFLPASRLKALRREFWTWAEQHKPAVRTLWLERARHARREQAVPLPARSMNVETVVRLAGREANPIADAVSARAPEHWREPDEEVALPDFCPEGQLDALRATLDALVARGARRFRVPALFGLDLLSHHRDVSITSTFPLPVCNSAAARELADLGVGKATSWVELDAEAHEALRGQCGSLYERFVYGRVPLLSTRYAITVAVQIRDARGATFTVTHEHGLTWLWPQAVMSIPVGAAVNTYLDLTHAHLHDKPESDFNHSREYV